jgi:hypothetical protein
MSAGAARPIAALSGVRAAVGLDLRACTVTEHLSVVYWPTFTCNVSTQGQLTYPPLEFKCLYYFY